MFLEVAQVVRGGTRSHKPDHSHLGPTHSMGAFTDHSLGSMPPDSSDTKARSHVVMTCLHGT